MIRGRLGCEYVPTAEVSEGRTKDIDVVTTQATVGGSPFGPFISVARGHSRE